MPLQLIRRYLTLADTNPIIFNITNSVVLFGLGDCFQQRMDINKSVLGNESKNTKKPGYNYYQTLKLMTYAAVFSPFTHLFYTKLLPKIMPVSDIPTGKELLKKIVVDYTLYSPP